MLTQMGLQSISATLCFGGLAALVTTFVLNTMVVARSPPLLPPTLPNYGTGELPSAVVDLSNSGFAALSRSYSQDSPPEAYLSTQNNYRATVGVRPLIWDKMVGAHAQNYADQRISDPPLIRPEINENQSSPAAIPPSSAIADPSTFLPPLEPPRESEYRISRPVTIDNLGIGVGSIAGLCALFSSLAFIFFFCRKRKEKAIDELVFNVSFGDEFGNGMGPREFSYNELAKATKNFAEAEKLGEGGFGSVYKGFLRESNADVAVKRISRRSKQGIKEFTSEVKIISCLRHKNLVKLIGWCHEKELLLVYEFMSNGSLDFHLFKGRSLLPWNLRFKIVQGLGSALLYLHELGDFCVLHRDIKTNNIMLDSGFNAKLGDFGLARLVDHEKGFRTTLLAGTIGYIAPECHRIGKATKESDIYSFGVVILEIACGRRLIEPKYEEDASLVCWVWEAYGNQRLLDVVDKNLSEDFDVKEMECSLIVGLWCAHPDPSMRPSIKKAIQVLNFETTMPNLPSKMPSPKFDIPSTSTVEISGAHFSNPSITLPR